MHGFRCWSPFLVSPHSSLSFWLFVFLRCSKLITFCFPACLLFRPPCLSFCVFPAGFVLVDILLFFLSIVLCCLLLLSCAACCYCPVLLSSILWFFLPVTCLLGLTFHPVAILVRAGHNLVLQGVSMYIVVLKVCHLLPACDHIVLLLLFVLCARHLSVLPACDPSVLPACDPSVLPACDPSVLPACDPSVFSACNSSVPLPVILYFSLPVILRFPLPVIIQFSLPVILQFSLPMIFFSSPCLWSFSSPCLLSSFFLSACHPVSSLPVIL